MGGVPETYNNQNFLFTDAAITGDRNHFHNILRNSTSA